MNSHAEKNFVRIQTPGEDREVQSIATPTAKPSEGPLNEEMIWNELKTIYDPEIPVNIVELGLIYSMKIQPLEQSGKRIEVDMTLTSPGCTMADVLKSSAESKLAQLPEVREVHVRIVFDPPWHAELMSEAAKLELGL